MVNHILKFFTRDVRGLHEAAYVLAGSAFFSQVLALVRDRLFASRFGAGEILDIYFASFKIPDLIFALCASLVSGAILIPLITEYIAQGKNDQTQVFLGGVLSFFGWLIFSVSLLSFFVIPYLAPILVPGFSESARESFILLSRLLLFQPVLLGLSNIFGSVTQSLRQFFIYALAPLFYNIGIIVGVLFLYEPFGVFGLGFGVLLGALLHFMVQVPTVIAAGFFPRAGALSRSEVYKILFLSFPRTVTLGTHQIIILIFTALASFVGAGAVSIFNFSYNLQSVPLAIIGVSYSVAAFPTLVRLISNGERKEFALYVATAARHIIFWSLPALALFVVLRAHIVRVILGAGNFGWDETRLSAAGLALFTFSVVAQGLVLLFVRGFYAIGDTKKPLFVNIGSAFVSLSAAFFLLHLFDVSREFRSFFEHLFRVEGIDGTKMLMLPLAFSFGTIVNLFLIWNLFKADVRDYYVSIRKSLFQALAGALIIGTVSFYILRILDDVYDINTFFGIFQQGFFAGLAGIFAGAIFLEIVGNTEIKELRRSFTRRVFYKRPILPDPGEV